MVRSDDYIPIDPAMSDPVPPEREYVEASDGTRVPIASGSTGWVIWSTMRDGSVCPICRPLEGVIFAEGEGLSPPRHDRCRCQLRPVDVDALPPHVKLRLARSRERAASESEERRLLEGLEELRKEDPNAADRILRYWIEQGVIGR